MKQINYLLFLFLFISTACENEKNNWFEIVKLDSKTYIIKEPFSSQNNSCYLIIGEKEAIIFDSLKQLTSNIEY